MLATSFYEVKLIRVLQFVIFSFVDRYRHSLNELMEAMREYRSKTCIKFARPRSTRDHHIRLMSGNGCVFISLEIDCFCGR